MRKSYVLMMIVVVGVLFTACSSKDETANELIDYYNEEWIPIQVQKNDMSEGIEINNILKELSNGTDESTQDLLHKELVHLMEQTYMPMMDEAIDEFTSIELENEEIKELNDMVIETEEFRKTVFEKLIRLYKDEISEEELEIEKDILRSKEEEDTNYLEELMDKNDLEYDLESDPIDVFYPLKQD